MNKRLHFTIFLNHSSILIRFFVSDFFQNPSEITEINMLMSYWSTYVWLCFCHISQHNHGSVIYELLINMC